jgi:hypothetical protein
MIGCAASLATGLQRPEQRNLASLARGGRGISLMIATARNSAGGLYHNVSHCRYVAMRGIEIQLAHAVGFASILATQLAPDTR